MTQNIAKTKRTSQAIDNFSFDEEYLMAGVIHFVENEDGTGIVRQKNLYQNSFKIPAYDTVEASYPTNESEVYTYKLNGTTVGTITITYTDSSKQYLISAVQT